MHTSASSHDPVQRRFKITLRGCSVIDSLYAAAPSFMPTSDKKEMFTIRQETEKDFAAVRDVIMLTFRDIEESDHTEHLLVERLRLSDAYIPGLSLVAETDGNKTVGHIMLSAAKVVSAEGEYTVLAVAPLSVLPGYQRRGIGSMLIREAHRRAASLGYGAAVLLGHKDYYPRFSYKQASAFGITFPFEAPDECCMAAELVKGGLDGIHGTVNYPDAFGL